MPNDHEFVEKFWKSIRSDMTAMLGTSSYPVRPMTAQFDGDRKTIYFFTSTETDLGKLGSQPTDASLIYAAKGHDLFANVDGKLWAHNDQEIVDRLWNRFVAAWFEGGKTDPKLCLLHFEPAHAQVWKDASSVVAGVKLFLGLGDPKEDYKDSVEDVDLRCD